MKFLAAKLDENGATTLAPEHGQPFQVVTRSKLRIPIEACPDPHEPTSISTMATPRWAVDHAVDSIVKLDHEREVIRKNDHLTDAGKQAEFVKPRAQALRTISTVAGTLAEHDSKVQAREVERYKVPTIAAQSFGETMRDFEIRQVVRSLTSADRSKMIQRLGSGEDTDLLFAVLRGPLPAEDLHKVATASWRALRDRSDPTGRAELDLAQASIEWARRIFHHVVGSARRILTVADVKFDDERFPAEQLYELTRDADSPNGKLSAGARLFGFDEQQAARYELLIKRCAA